MKIREVTAGDLPRLERLFESRDLACAGSELLWKLDNPGYVGACAVGEDEELTAYYALLEVEVPAPDERVAVAVDAVTHPAHSSFGLIYDVMRACYRRSEEIGQELLLGIPTPAMQRVLEFVGWKPLRKHLVCISRADTEKLELRSGHGRSTETAYQRWRWDRCPRPYRHLAAGRNITFAERPDIFPAPMLMGGDAATRGEIEGRLEFCYLVPEDEAPVAAEILEELPVFYLLLAEPTPAEAPKVSLDFSLVEALTLGW